MVSFAADILVVEPALDLPGTAVGLYFPGTAD
jgi:hypothetical protein